MTFFGLFRFSLSFEIFYFLLLKTEFDSYWNHGLIIIAFRVFRSSGKSGKHLDFPPTLTWNFLLVSIIIMSQFWPKIFFSPPKFPFFFPALGLKQKKLLISSLFSRICWIIPILRDGGGRFWPKYWYDQNYHRTIM